MTRAGFGTVCGVERHLPGRGVRWAVVGDDCKLGHWYTEAPAICLGHEDDPDPDCGISTRSGADLLAGSATDPPGTAPVVAQETAGPPACLGPEVCVFQGTPARSAPPTAPKAFEAFRKGSSKNRHNRGGRLMARSDGSRSGIPIRHYPATEVVTGSV